MLGKPKYKYGDKVRFSIYKNSLSNSKIELKGEIWIIDSYGTFDDDSDVSYDILVKNYYKDRENGDCLFKHINEKLIIDENYIQYYCVDFNFLYRIFFNDRHCLGNK